MKKKKNEIMNLIDSVGAGFGFYAQKVNGLRSKEPNIMNL